MSELEYPPLSNQVLQDSVSSRIGQSSRPYSPISTTAVSVLGGAKTVNCVDLPALRSIIVEFCTNPFSGFIMRYGTNAVKSDSAVIVTPWKIPPVSTLGVIETSLPDRGESTSSPKQPLKGAKQNNRARNPAVIVRCMHLRVCNPFSMLRLFVETGKQRFHNLLSPIIT